MSLSKLLAGSALGLFTTATGAQPIMNQAQWEQDPATDHIVLGGSTHTTGSFRSDKPILIDQTLMLETQADTVVHLGGPIGNVTGMRKGIQKTGDGTLVLSGTNNYDNVTNLGAGTLWVQSDKALGTIGSFLQVYQGTTLVYQPGVVVPNNLHFINQAYDTAQPPVGPNANSLQWRVDSGMATQHGYMVLGQSWVLKQGAGILRLAGNAFDSDGRFAVQQGGLVVDGSFMGTVFVADGAWLQGQGELGAARIAAGGSLRSAPGASGLLVSRDLVFDPDALFMVGVDATGAGGPVRVQGSAILAGWVLAHTADLAADLWPASWEYPILQADGGFAGTAFDGVDSNASFLTARLRYDDHQVYLRLSPNAQAASVWPFSGAWAASVLSALTEDSRFIRHAALQHATGPRTGAFLWADAYYSDAQRGGYAGVPGDQRDLSGVVLGMQQSVGRFGRVNGFVGVQHGFMRSGTAASAAFLQASASARMNSSHIGLSAAWQGDSVTWAVGAAHTWHSLSSQRHVAAGGFTDNPSARYRGRTSQVFGELSVNAWQSASSRVTPFVQLAWVQTRVDAHAEQGGPAALQFAPARHSVLYSTLGVKGEHTVDTSLGMAKVYGSLAWRYVAGSITPRSRYAYANDVALGGFTAYGLAVSRNAVLVQAGVSAELVKGISFNVGYTGQHARRYHDHGVSLGMQMTF